MFAKYTVQIINIFICWKNIVVILFTKALQDGNGKVWSGTYVPGLM